MTLSHHSVENNSLETVSSPEFSVNKVRPLCSEIARNSEHVTINEDRIKEIAEVLAPQEIVLPDWSWAPYPQFQDKEQLVRYMLVLSSVNYCFFHPGLTTAEGKEVRFNDGKLDGSILMTKCITDHWDTISDPEFLARIDLDYLKEVLFAANVPIPLIEKRQEHLQEVGRYLSKLEAVGTSLSEVMEKRGGDAYLIAEEIASKMNGFGRDPFLKRAQLFSMMTYGRFQHRDDNPVTAESLSTLTAVLDYRLPQTDFGTGILEATPELMEKLENRVAIPEDSPEEREIRALEGVSFDMLLEEINKLRPADDQINPAHLDFLKWKAPRDYQKGRADPRLFVREMPPHHQTVTTNY